VELDFSTDPERNLTVIRAANDSGKTTVLLGLQWALYGDPALSNRGKAFRLHPIDWTTTDGPQAVITATVDYEHTTFRHSRGRTIERTRRYRIVRTALENISDWKARAASTVELFCIEGTRTIPLPTPDSEIDAQLPQELREVFFTDGDRALSFIEADVSVSTKRKRVQDAIRSLLGLGILDKVLPRVRKYGLAVNKKAKTGGTTGELRGVLERLEQTERTWDDVTTDLNDAREQFAAFDSKLREIDSDIESALRAGDREQLAQEIRKAKRHIAKLNEQMDAASDDHAQLLSGRVLALSLVQPLTKSALAQLATLRERGRIPNTTVPVLQECIARGICICGESLSSSAEGGSRRHRHIQGLVNEAKRADDLKDVITGLYFRTRELRVDGSPTGAGWIERFQQIEGKRTNLEDLRDDAGRQLRALQLKVKELPDTNVQGLRKVRRGYREQRDRFLAKRVSCEARLSTLERELARLKDTRQRLLAAQKRGAFVLAQLEVANDVQTVLTQAYSRITNDEVREVSRRMNAMFLEMIGVDEEQGSIIRRAEVSSEFDIIVYGPHDRMLDPDQDLNGASWRALTLAFILALARVSEVEAPNLIDTPLGMTAGYVRHSMLQTAIRESLQLVLLLTHDEIVGCEELIDEKCGAVYTLSNPAHYPLMLVHDPEAKRMGVVRCECDHRSTCEVCERRVKAALRTVPHESGVEDD